MATRETLESWTGGGARAAIIEFVRSLAEPEESFVAPAERVATFDNDGTLWCEKPLVEAAGRGWTIVSMKHDFLAVF